MTENLGISPEGWAQIQEQFKNIISEAGVEPEETYLKELEEIFGMSIEEMNRDTENKFDDYLSPNAQQERCCHQNLDQLLLLLLNFSSAVSSFALWFFISFKNFIN